METSWKRAPKSLCRGALKSIFPVKGITLNWKWLDSITYKEYNSLFQDPQWIPETTNGTEADRYNTDIPMINLSL